MILSCKNIINIIRLYVGVSFNLHKDAKNYYRKLLILFKPFHGLKTNLKCQHISWKDVYFNVKNNIEK
jgi:hypothetical protein